ncbi:hypothetical protein [Risungbinella massiliensis]|uniref:hypothetical protein n=1 Tax=Risungbinella massiliensis TaxID=1329796 RepID=UPI0005CC3F44|nr:hypothetical protein [Risungbinella massiliensis]
MDALSETKWFQKKIEKDGKKYKVKIAMEFLNSNKGFNTYVTLYKKKVFFYTKVEEGFYRDLEPIQAVEKLISSYESSRRSEKYQTHKVNSYMDHFMEWDGRF